MFVIPNTNGRSVELTIAEEFASDAFQLALEGRLEGGLNLGIMAAMEHIKATHPGLDPEFYLWLSGDHSGSALSSV